MTIDRRKFVLGSAAVLAGALVAPAAFARGRTLEEILSWKPISTHSRAVIEFTFGGNSLMVVSQGEVLVIDSMFPYLGPLLRSDAAEAGAKVSLLNTHHHGDHTGGNNAFVGQGQSYAHPKAIERIKGQFDKYLPGAEAAVREASNNLRGNERALEIAMKVAEHAENMDINDFVPTTPINDGDTITVGELTLNLHHFGAGHTDNDIVVHIPEDNVIHTGDLVFSGLHPFYDPTAGVTARGWIKSLDGVLAICDKDTTVVPGHGESGGKEIIENMRSYHEQLIEAVETEIAKGTAKEDAQQMSWPFMDGLGFEQIKGRAIGAVYDEMSGN